MESKYEESIIRSLRRINRAIGIHSRYLASQFGLTIPQLICLRTLARLGEITPGTLAKEVSLSQGTITGIVDRLTARQLVERERSTKDRRQVLLAITPTGQEMIENAPSPLQEQFANQLAALPEENQHIIHTVLEQIIRMMKAEKVEAAPLLSAESPTVLVSEGEEFLNVELGKLPEGENGPPDSVVSESNEEPSDTKEKT